MSMEDTQKRLRELLSKGASQEEMLRQLSLAEGCGIKVFCEEQIVAGTEKKIHRWCGYITHCDDPAESIPETVYGAWMDGGCPGK
ncbi:MAG: hypothetical protein E4G89_04875 [Methanothrix sp.]|nr:MAG: hypothetical protein E4G89_04875 [Methanothrix sp.]